MIIVQNSMKCRIKFVLSNGGFVHCYSVVLIKWQELLTDTQRPILALV